MELKTNTRFNMGDTVYFLNSTHDISKGLISRITTTTRVYKDSYTGEQKDFVVTEYDVTTTYDDLSYTEENLFSSPDEILAMFNDQIAQGDFD